MPDPFPLAHRRQIPRRRSATNTTRTVAKKHAIWAGQMFSRMAKGRLFCQVMPLGTCRRAIGDAIGDDRAIGDATGDARAIGDAPNVSDHFDKAYLVHTRAKNGYNRKFRPLRHPKRTRSTDFTVFRRPSPAFPQVAIRSPCQNAVKPANPVHFAAPSGKDRRSAKEVVPFSSFGKHAPEC